MNTIKLIIAQTILFSSGFAFAGIFDSSCVGDVATNLDFAEGPAPQWVRVQGFYVGKSNQNKKCTVRLSKQSEDGVASITFNSILTVSEKPGTMCLIDTDNLTEALPVGQDAYSNSEKLTLVFYKNTLIEAYSVKRGFFRDSSVSCKELRKVN
jgi:hypothetical protein